MDNAIEIMAPVGSMESLAAAIQGGADSVYFGIGKLNMRSRSSQNFTLNDLSEVCKICSERKIKTYLTLNTVVYDEEMAEMHKLVDAAKKSGITAIIASDQSVIQYAYSQGVAVHISTQANISNTEALRYWSRYADLMVTARELSLEQVKNISRNIEKDNICGPSGKPVRLEIFVHGALCMAISGKCYLSLDNYNASANRGACYQVCRKPYRVFDKEGEVELEIDNEYIMSPKDLKTIDFLDKIIDAGPRVLKIEGRGRSPEYVKTVTECYKEAALAVMNGTYSQDKIEDWNKRLTNVYNRGFWDGYYQGRKIGEWSEVYGSQAGRKKEYVGKITNYFSRLKVVELKVEARGLNVGDEILIIGPTTGVHEDKVMELRLDDVPVDKVQKGVVCSLPLNEFVRRSDKLYKIVYPE